MADHELRRLLKQLHAEMEQVKKTGIDDQGRELLRSLGRDVNALLEQTEALPLKAQPTLTRNLQEAIRHFEVTHAALTAALSELLTALSNAGI